MVTVTVLITCFKEGELLLRAYNSLIDQTDKDFQILIVNDASVHPPTNECCELLEGKGITIIWRKSNGGLSAARNTGFEAATDVIVPLDADDTLPPDAISIIKKSFNDNPETYFIFGNYRKIRDGFKEEIISCQPIVNHTTTISPKNVLNNWILLGTSPCRKSLWQMIGGYSVEFTNTLQDMDFWQKAFEKEIYGTYVDKIIYNWHLQTDGMNASVKSFDVNLLRFRHKAFYFENSNVSKKELANTCFLSFYGSGHCKLVKELLFSMPFHLTIKNAVKSVVCLLFPLVMEKRIKKINQTRRLY